MRILRLGRRFWLVEASFQMFACEIIMGTVIATQMTPEGTFPQVGAAASTRAGWEGMGRWRGQETCGPACIPSCWRSLD